MPTMHGTHGARLPGHDIYPILAAQIRRCDGISRTLRELPVPASSPIAWLSVDENPHGVDNLTLPLNPAAWRS